MVVRGPVVALVLLGLVPAALWPGRAGVVAAGWLLGVALLVVVDLLLTPSPRSLLADRGEVPAVRLGGSTTAELPWVVHRAACIAASCSAVTPSGSTT